MLLQLQQQTTLAQAHELIDRLANMGFRVVLQKKDGYQLAYCQRYGCNNTRAII